jgi:thymidylate synthase (FAD)
MKLSNGEVNLIAVTQPKITKDGLDAGLEPAQMHPMSAEEFIAYCARVSNPSNQTNTDTANKLLKYLVKHKHWSPFEMVSITMEIKTTRDIGRQILRHRSFSFQEFSQRYAAVLNWADTRETRLQDSKNRQNSIDISEAKKEDPMTADSLDKEWHTKQQTIIDTTSDFYKWALDNGIAKEQARVILPEGLTMSHMYVQGTLRSWIHYCGLRMEGGTQKEHRLIADACWKLITFEFPSLEGILEEE